MTTTTTNASDTSIGTVTRLLQRQILPIDRDTDVFALYVDLEEAKLDTDRDAVGGDKAAKDLNNAAIRQSTSTGRKLHPDQIRSRTALRLEPSQTLSFGTYFNAFPASYWRRHTVVDDVELSVSVSGAGATVTVYKSMARGHAQRVDAATVEGDCGTFTFALSLKPFVDGGWYWYDVVAGDDGATVESAEWTAQVPADRAEHGTVDVCITTMLPDMSAQLLGQLGDAEELAPYLDTVFVMDQGKDKVVDSEYFPAAKAGLGDTLRVIPQGNLGGSGGYARGQLESVRKGTATYAMMMDDDVVCEPEGIIRAVTFGDLAKRPTIVGGHMFNLYSRSELHSFGEIVQPWRFWWQTRLDGYSQWDFAARNLRSSRWLHKRADVDFNGWFMCLIPRVVLEEVGLSLPVFIKWDDSEFGLRAKAAGYPTVSFPGAAVWHVPWTDKNDGLDWQSYFHQRNRFIAALLHSPYERGGRMVRESLNHQVKHLASLQYSTAELRHLALEDVLRGPQALHGELATKLADINAFRKQWSDAQLHTDRDDLPPVRRKKPPKKGKSDIEIPGRKATLVAAALAPLRQLRPVRDMSGDYPETELTAMDAKWWNLVKYDSAVVSMNDGTSVALYKRDPAHYRDLLKRTVDIHRRFHREWPELARQYREALGEITSPEAWERTFAPWTDDEAAGSSKGEG
ncbi:galactofuranosylgalactofuranosylrhamnosyl-N-acetylglucosaminyl-diphospho-decaprenol beta-1,5/1,6-galactofuranosyltransferase [Nocardioides cavernae]|uniref:Galactofuranosylgalactofuranosylrhamnosyl-N-acetylglucosaminyl-diphospho-decaprenol beta-1,5/1,6-galactofuranosyltransferase n=1 Tax=Nocardioides cavernae TaxID=1921566 RepID=A0A7Y9KU18_9ACTN|nr:glycosyltransferase [Nocardioides cavernae]NYE37453.1 galactofuranosylgalactofuranosylrhamnosyl-N-acetylglucosaminyl-diphospho-decaprenol beta-1,5/1,6-galactofuranosyltransferase [Nocardioides cavernae]